MSKPSTYYMLSADYTELQMAKNLKSLTRQVKYSASAPDNRRTTENTIHTTYFVLWPSSSSKDFIYPGCHNFSCSISLYIKSLKSFLLFFFVLFLMHNTFLFLFSKCEKIQHQVVNCIFHKFPLL